MAVNKVIYNGNTLLDLTGVTVTADKVLEGYRAHDKAGNLIIGTMSASGGCDVLSYGGEAVITIPTTMATVSGTNLIFS